MFALVGGKADGGPGHGASSMHAGGAAAPIRVQVSPKGGVRVASTPDSPMGGGKQPVVEVNPGGAYFSIS